MAIGVGFIGLGMMGNPMVRRLLGAGYAVTGFDVVPEKVHALERHGMRPAASAREVAEHADIIITMLLKPEHIEASLFGPQGIVASRRRGVVHVEMSTMSPHVQQDWAQRLKRHAVEKLDAPVSGTTPQAEQGILTVMAGGDRPVFDQVRHVFGPLSRHVFYMGDHGMGAWMKLVTNHLLNVNMATLAEGLLLGQRAGIEREYMLQVLGTGVASSRALDIKGRKFIERDFAPEGKVEIYCKDLGLIHESGRRLGLTMPMTASALDLYRKTAAAGMGELDCVAVIQTLENLADRPPGRTARRGAGAGGAGKAAPAGRRKPASASRPRPAARSAKPSGRRSRSAQKGRRR
ncbi:MAG TPA: NAD(P)-dependent oxidoreductase [Candidatus Methylomirabilis sp.]|jgi:2-hydroxy-3-oxopropionate reductase